MTSIGFVVDQIQTYFNPSKIDILCRKENIETLKKIKIIKNFIEYNSNKFDNKGISREYIKNINKDYDFIVIPINGNVYSYNNVYQLSKSLFGKDKEVFFCDYNLKSMFKINVFQRCLFNFKPLIYIILAPMLFFLVIMYVIVLFILNFFTERNNE